MAAKKAIQTLAWGIDHEKRYGLFNGQRWGVWGLDANRLVLVHTLKRYEIDLETIDSSAAMLDWIFQLQARLSPQEMVDLLSALNDIFRPQENLCSGGADMRINPTKFLQQRIARRSNGDERSSYEP